MNNLAKRLDSLENQFAVNDNSAERLVYSIVNSNGKEVRRIHDFMGEWQQTDLQADLEIPEKLEPVLTRPKRFIVVIGGRGSGKSQNIGAIEVARMRDYGIKLGCFREFQNSIEDSVYSLLNGQVDALGLDGFSSINNAIKRNNGASAKFKGLARNPDSMKSMDGFNDFWIEEAQATSANSLKLLTPTMRSKGGRMIFTANPGSSEDPFSKRFITPFQDHLDRDGIYEDDLHLIIVMNYTDNPWFPEELRQERDWDYENLPRALYDHIWEGRFNDSVENSLIMAEWFDACIDAHVKLGFRPQGIKIAAHDPSDTGPDSKGFAVRHGSVILSVNEKTDGDINEGGDWATGLALTHGVDAFTWDCDGMGVGLNRQVAKAFDGKRINASMFKGSEKPDFPDAIYNPTADAPILNQKTWAETCKNKRAQYYLMLRDRVYRTYRAVVHNEYHDPDQMISFDSSIKNLSKLRAELCRIPVKPNANGLFELYTKPEMKSKFSLSSPNLGDSVMMLMRHAQQVQAAPRMPQPLKPIGRR